MIKRSVEGIIGDAVISQFDRFCWVIDGWCFVLSDLDASIRITVESLEGEIISESVTSGPRPDLIQHFPQLSDNNTHGFSFALPAFSLPKCFLVRCHYKDKSMTLAAFSDQKRVEGVIDIKQEYENILRRVSFKSKEKRLNIVVSSLDINSGRGDLYVALGLGFRLEDLGYECLLTTAPIDSDVLVLMLPIYYREISTIKATKKIAWIRNALDEWLQSPSLFFVDGVLCSSVPALERIKKVFNRYSGILRLAAEHELFKPGPGFEGLSLKAVSTINGWKNGRGLFQFENLEDLDLSIFGQLDPELRQHPVANLYKTPVSFFDLPKIYNSAKVCVDSFNQFTAPYGFLNSRVFEALSCGIPVVTSKPDQMDNFHIAGLKFYESIESLKQQIDEIYKSNLFCSAEGNSWEVRAGEFDAFVESIPTTCASKEVAFFPPYLDNPYQLLLYSTLERQGIRGFPVYELEQALSYDALHIHWISPLTQIAHSANQSATHVSFIIRRLQRYIDEGGRLIFTLHNINSHELSFDESLLKEWLIKNSSLVHSLSRDICPEGVVAEIGHYRDFYPDTLERLEARRILGFKDVDRVILVFGQLRRYKETERLLEVLDCPVKFLVVGEPKGVSEDLIAQLSQKTHLVNRRVDDHEVQIFFKAADYFLLLSSCPLNSSSAVLARSFGLPVIAFSGSKVKADIICESVSELRERLNDLSVFDRDQLTKKACLELDWDKLVAPLAEKILSEA